jgi:hypothetical protein
MRSNKLRCRLGGSSAAVALDADWGDATGDWSAEDIVDIGSLHHRSWLQASQTISYLLIVFVISSLLIVFVISSLLIVFVISSLLIVFVISSLLIVFVISFLLIVFVISSL